MDAFLMDSIAVVQFRPIKLDSALQCLQMKLKTFKHNKTRN